MVIIYLDCRERNSSARSGNGIVSLHFSARCGDESNVIYNRQSVCKVSRYKIKTSKLEQFPNAMLNAVLHERHPSTSVALILE